MSVFIQNEDGDYKELTWRNVLDCYQNYGRWRHIDEFVKVVKMAGYQYFNWNGLVFEIYGDSYKRTGIKVSQLSE